MKKIILPIIVACLFITHANAQVTVSGSNNSTVNSTNYATLGAAITAIGTSQSGQTIDIAISASTTEAASGIIIGPGTWTSLTIYPTAENVTLTSVVSSNALIQFSGATNVTIDGRVNQTGARSMTLSNTGTTNATVNFTNAAQSNIVKYCTITGAGPANKGLIGFGSAASVANGNGLNTIDHNLVTNNGTRPVNAIYSNGNGTNPNTGNLITNNEFKDCSNLGVVSQIIGLGIATGNNTGWTISGNSFYDTDMTASAGFTNTIIHITTGTGYTISDNYIGGNAANCTGTWTKTGNNVSFMGINLSSATAGANTIQNNIIKNISWTNSGGGTWTGILVGSASAATIDGNYIGDNTTTGSITTSNGDVNGVVTGINITSTSAVDCINNKIGSITANSSGFVVAINAINRGTQAANTTITGNIIGSSTATNSIYSSTNIASQNVKGIVCTGTGTNTISNNEIGSLTTASTSGVVNAIDLGAGTNTVNANLIYNLSSPNSVSTALNGINLPASGINTCSNNIISLGNNYANTINGINEVLSTTANNFYHNTIYITGTPTSVALNSIGINSLSTSNNRNIKNNLIFNNRVNGTGATGKNYALSLAAYSSGTFACDYNNLYVTANVKNFVGKYGGSDKQSFADWKASLANLDANSENNNPNFVLTNPLLSDAYYPGNSNLTTTNVIGTVTTDYTGATRHASTPTIGALEYGKAVYDGIAWNIGSAPNSASTDAALTGNYSGVGFTCKNFTINAGKQASITSSTLSVNGDFTLKSDAANGTATFIDNGGTLSVTGANKVEQYLTSGRNWYISSPVSAATSNVFAATATKPMYYYVETIPNTWSQITNTSTNLDAKKGYIANINSDRVVTFTGGSLNTGTQTISGLTGSGATFTGFNLVGNPYPSYLSWDGATRTNVGTSIWYKSKSTGAYVLQTYNSAGGGATNGGTNLIPPMQAFWVKVTAGQTGSIVFDNTDRAHTDQSVATNRLKAPAVDTRKTVRLQVSNGINADEALIYADDNALDTYDTYDSNKMFNNNAAVPEIYTVIGTEKLAINGFNNLSDNQTIALGFKTTVANTFTIKASEVKNFATGTKIILVDNQKPNEEFDLSEGVSYNFSSDITNDMTRFSLLFRSPGSTTGINNTEQLNAKVFVNAANQITIIAHEKSNYAIYNAVGQLIENGQTAAKQQTANSKLNIGVYVVRVNNHSTRVIIK